MIIELRGWGEKKALLHPLQSLLKLLTHLHALFSIHANMQNEWIPTRSHYAQVAELAH